MRRESILIIIMWILLSFTALLAIVAAYDVAQPAVLAQPVFANFPEVGVDNGYSRSKGKEKMYTCKKHHLKVMKDCRNSGEGKIDDELPCYAPEIHLLRHYKKSEGRHALVTCANEGSVVRLKDRLPHQFQVEFVNSDGTVISQGVHETSKVVKCSKRGDWITETSEGRWVLLKNVYCL